MNRSFVSYKRTNPHSNKHKLSQSQSSSGFRKVLKNRSNHSNTSKESSDSKYIDRVKLQNRKTDMENMK